MSPHIPCTEITFTSCKLKNTHLAYISFQWQTLYIHGRKKEKSSWLELGEEGIFSFQQTGMLIHSNRPVSVAATKCSPQVTGGNSRLLIGLLIFSFVGQWGSSSATHVSQPTAHRLGNICNPNQSMETSSGNGEQERKLWQGRMQKFILIF